MVMMMKGWPSQFQRIYLKLGQKSWSLSHMDIGWIIIRLFNKTYLLDLIKWKTMFFNLSINYTQTFIDESLLLKYIILDKVDISIHILLFVIRRLSFNSACPEYDISLHLIVRFQFWRTWCASSLPLLPGPLWLRVVVPVRVPSVGI